MAIIIKSNNPQMLLETFVDGINSNEIATWIVDSDNDFTIANAKWAYKAWMRPIIKKESNCLVFGIVSSTKHEITKGLYGIFHGRLVATLLSHYDELILSIDIQPFLDKNIDVF